jgi:hypothetical protein
MDGEGISYCTADLSDLYQTTCERVNSWAVGYPLLISVLNVLTGDLILSSILLDVLGLVLLFRAFCTVFGLLDLRGTPFFLFTIFTAFSFTPYYYTGSTDFLSAALFLSAAAMTLKSLSSPPSTPLYYLLIGCVAGAAAFLRYAYYPFLGVMPFLLVLAGIRSRNKKVITGGLLAGFSSFALLGCMLIFHAHYFGTALHIKGGGAAYLGHLLHMDPFPLKAAVYTDIIDQNIKALLPGITFLLKPASMLLSLFVLGVILFHFMGCRIRRAVEPAQACLPFFHLILLLTLLVNVALFSYYSIRNPPQTGWTDFWTYVQETRYYAPSMFLIQIALVLAFFHPPGGMRITRYALGILLGAALFFSVAFGLYRAYKVHAAQDLTKYATRMAKVTEVVEMIDTITGSGDRRAVYADGVSVHDACLVALRSSARIIMDYQGLLKNPLEATGPVTLFLRIARNRPPLENAFIATHSAKRVIELYRSDIFRVDL